MQYIQKWFEQTKLRTPTATHVQAAPTDTSASNATTAGPAVAESFRAMRESNIMMPLDLLTDERNLYSIMPYCDGGELFERLDLNERFSEDEARYWMDQILNVSSSTVLVGGLFLWSLDRTAIDMVPHPRNMFVSCLGSFDL